MHTKASPPSSKRKGGGHKKGYKRVLLKLSGEALGIESGIEGDDGAGGVSSQGIDPKVLDRTAVEIGQIAALGVQTGVVIGGGNLFRGAELSAAGLDRVTGDHMGMLATIMNALAMGDALTRADVPVVVMSAIPISGVAETWDRRIAMQHLAAGKVVIFSGGTGNPFFTTDSAACLRGIEIDADIVLKATKVDGVYDADPVVHQDAKKYDRLTYDEVIERQLGVMDLTAICLARDYDMPIRVFRMIEPGALRNAVMGESEGTLVQK